MKLVVDGTYVLAVIVTLFVCGLLSLLVWSCVTRQVQGSSAISAGIPDLVPLPAPQVQAVPGAVRPADKRLLPPPPDFLRSDW